MITAWYLTIFFWIATPDGMAWVSGDQYDGWSARAYETEELCIDRRSRANQIVAQMMLDDPKITPIMWACVSRLSGIKL